MVTRTDIFQYADENYKTKPEYLWAKYPNSGVLRNNQSRKRYAIIMDIPRNKLGLSGEDIIDILDVKCEPDMIVSLLSQKGFFPAYHMNKQHWITIALDGTVSDQEIYHLLDLSYEMTK